MRIIAGSLYGQASPVTTFSPLFYADATLQAGASSPSKTSTKNERFISSKESGDPRTSLRARTASGFFFRR